jgi:hypothetical protein
MGRSFSAIVVRAKRISESVFMAAASFVASMVSLRQPGASPPLRIRGSRGVTATLAVKIVAFTGFVLQIQSLLWQPESRLFKNSAPQSRPS